jgi:hypothetical protein
MTDVIVEVSGGVVVEVYSKNPRTRVVVIDWDDIEDGGTRAGVAFRQCASYEMMPGETQRATEYLRYQHISEG